LGGKIVINDTAKYTGSCFVNDKYDSLETTNYYKNGIKSRIVHRERVKDIYITDRDESFNEEGKTTRIINRKRVNDTTIMVKDISFNEEGKQDGWELSIRETKSESNQHLFFMHVESLKEYKNGIESYSYNLDFESSLDIFYTSGGPSTSFVELAENGLDGDKKRICVTETQYYNTDYIETSIGFFECIKSKNLKGFWYKYYPKK